MSENELTFSVDSLLLSELGERLVTKNYVALAELVKNAYDADATKVKVIFVNARAAPNEKSEIRIVDNGLGMTFQQIKEFWMRIATPNKLRNPTSPRFGRKKTGDKGVGRFACRRLARKLILESTAEIESSGQLEYTRVEFDWEKFEAGITLTEVPNEYTIKAVSKANTGLTLRLVGLREPWTQTEFNVLRRQILGLSVKTGVRRKGLLEDPGFDVVFEAPEFKMKKMRLRDQIMVAGWGRLTGSISNDGTASLKLEAMQIGTVKFELPFAFSKIPGVTCDIGIIWRNKEYCRDTSILTLGVIDEISREWSGVHVYLDGFRVFPYGDPGNDWLDIDRDVARRKGKADDMFRRVSANLLGVDHSRAMLSHPRNGNLVGRVFASNHPNKILDVLMNREGFVANEAFEQMKKFVRLGLEWATIYYNHFLHKIQQERIIEEARKLKKATARFEEISKDEVSEKKAVPIVRSALDVMEKSVKVAVSDFEELPAKSKKDLYVHAEEAKRVVEKSFSHMERQLNVLRTIASTGALMLTFVHEAKMVVGSLDTHAGRLERLAERFDEKDRQEFIDLAKALRRTRDRFDNQIKLFQGVSIDLTLTNRRKVLLGKILSEVTDCFQGLIDQFNIDIELDMPKSLRTGPMLESEVYSILINLISNAVKVVIASDEGQRIKLEAFKGKDETVFRVYDDGIGLSRESRDLVVMPLVADPEGRLYRRLKEKMKYEDLMVVGEGSGLGLSIVKDIVEHYEKNLRFIDVEDPWKTCVEVTLP